MLICLHACMFYQYLIVILIANPLIRLYTFSYLLYCAVHEDVLLFFYLLLFQLKE